MRARKGRLGPACPRASPGVYACVCVRVCNGVLGPVCLHPLSGVFVFDSVVVCVYVMYAFEWVRE